LETAYIVLKLYHFIIVFPYVMIMVTTEMLDQVALCKFYCFMFIAICQ